MIGLCLSTSNWAQEDVLIYLPMEHISVVDFAYPTHR